MLLADAWCRMISAECRVVGGSVDTRACVLAAAAPVPTITIERARDRATPAFSLLWGLARFDFARLDSKWRLPTNRAPHARPPGSLDPRSAACGLAV